METVTVKTSGPTYSVRIGPGLLAGAGQALQGLGVRKPVAILADARLAATYGEELMESLRAAQFEPSLVGIPGGERSKSLAEVGPLL